MLRALALHFEAFDVWIRGFGHDDNEASGFDVIVRLHTALFETFSFAAFGPKTLVSLAIFLERERQVCVAAGHVVHDFFEPVNEATERVAIFKHVPTETCHLQVVDVVFATRAARQHVT